MNRTFNSAYQQPQYRGSRFMGIQPVFATGPERERVFLHPNAVSVWTGKR